jgi:hypothetical protein
MNSTFLLYAVPLLQILCCSFRIFYNVSFKIQQNDLNLADGLERAKLATVESCLCYMQSFISFSVARVHCMSTLSILLGLLNRKYCGRPYDKNELGKQCGIGHILGSHPLGAI